MTHEFPYILLADDDPDDRDFFRSAMQRLYPQVNIRTFEDGDQLLEYLDKCSSLLFPVCIWLDYKMSRLNAPQILQATGSGTRYARIPKIVWSTSTREQDLEECLNNGAARFVVKPATDDHLDTELRLLDHWINAGCLH
jgi:CheY-like chemotaxis protein